MASVAELLMAAQAKKSPFISLLEGAAQGFGKAQDTALDRNIKLLQSQQLREELAYQNEQRAKLRAQEQAKNKAMTENKISTALREAGHPVVVTPIQKLQDLEETTTVDSKGGVSTTYKKGIPKEPDILDQEWKQARTDYYREKASDVNEQQDERDYKRRERRNAERTGVVNRFNADPSVKKSQQMIDGAGVIQGLVTSDNPIAAGAIPTFMARASGEVGNLSEADKAPFGGSRALLARLEAAVTQAATGKLTPDNRQFILQLTDIMQKRANTNLRDLAKKRARQYSKASDFLSEDDILSTLVPDMDDMEEEVPAPTGKAKKSGRFVIEVEE